MSLEKDKWSQLRLEFASKVLNLGDLSRDKRKTTVFKIQFAQLARIGEIMLAKKSQMELKESPEWFKEAISLCGVQQTKRKTPFQIGAQLLNVLEM